MKKINILYNSVYDKISTVPQAVKKSLIKNNFLNYYFADKKKIISWNKKNDLIKFKYINIKIELVEKFEEFFNNLYIQNLLPVSEYLDKILENGWQSGVISIAEYNLIVLFTDFCRKYSIVEKKKNLSDKDFFTVEESFFKITVNPENIKIMIVGLKKVLNYFKRLYLKNTDDIECMVNQVDCFFIQRFFYPSFFDLVLAFNMVYYKKYFEWDDIVEKKKSQVIQTDFYDCTKEVFEQIIYNIKNITERIKKLKKEMEEIKWIKSLSEISKNEGPEKLIKYYNNSGHNWEQDTDDFLALMLTLFNEIIIDLNRFIFKETEVMDLNEKMIHIKIINDEKLEDLFKKMKEQYDLARAKYINIIPPRILVKEYLKSDYPENYFKEPDQKYIFEKILKLFNYIREFAMVFRDKYNDNKDDKNIEDYLKYMLADIKGEKGKFVEDIFKFYTELFMQICGYFKDRQIEIKVRKYNLIVDGVKQDEKRLSDLTGNNESIKMFIKEYNE